MQTLHSVIKHGLFMWDRTLIPESVFQERLARVQAAIADAGHVAWLIYGDAMRYGDVAYVTNFLPRTRGALALVPREGLPSILVSSGPRDIPSAKNQTWVDDVRPYTRLPGEAARMVTERGLERERIGFVGIEESLTVGEWEEIRRLLPGVQWEEVGGQLAGMRAAKDGIEVAVMRRAAAMAQDGLENAAQALRSGLSERRALAAVERLIRLDGAEDVRFLIASGPRASISMRPGDDRILNNGDVVLLYIAVEYQRYWAEAGQTYVLGQADAKTRELVDAATAALAAMTAAARTGVRAGAVADAAVARLGGANAAKSALAYGLGHGIGLDPDEAPGICPGESTSLVEGATLALNVVLHGQDGHGAMVAQTMLVGANGALALADKQAGLIECLG